MQLDCPLLDALEETDRRALLARSIPRHLERGDVLYLAGDRSQRAHVLVRGVVKLAARTPDGHVTILGLALAGDVVGDVAALDGMPQPMDAIAATSTDALGVPGALLVEASARSAAAALELARSLARRNRWLCDAAIERSSATVPARLAGRLLDLADVLGRIREGTVELDLPLAQDDLGRLAGMSRESACKTLRSFQASGLLAYRGKRLRILRPDALERIRCSGRRRR